MSVKPLGRHLMLNLKTMRAKIYGAKYWLLSKKYKLINSTKVFLFILKINL
jgi:hypothetical protein